jgi:hypothetical protein
MSCRGVDGSGPLLDSNELTSSGEITLPFPVHFAPPEECLDVGAQTERYRFELGDGFAPADDRESLASVFDRIEQVCKVCAALVALMSGAVSDNQILREPFV